MFLGLELDEKIVKVLLFGIVYLVSILVVSFLTIFFLKKKKKFQRTKTITSHDVFSSEERLISIELSSSKLGRENHREFLTDIFDTVKSGLEGNNSLAQISDCDMESV